MQYRRKHAQHWPRSWFSLFMRFGGWIAIAAGALLFLVTYFSVTQTWIADSLDRDGRFVGALITKLEIVHGTDSDGDPTTDHFATFRYKTAQGGQEQRRVVSTEEFENWTEGQAITIRYLRSDPTVMEHQIGKYRADANGLRWLALFLGVLGLYLLWRLGGRAARAIVVRRDGEKRFAEVSGIRNRWWKLLSKRRASLQWREADGSTGESLPRPKSELANIYRAGDRIVVFRLGHEAYWEGDVGPPRREV